jgi:endonuclease G
MLKQLFLVLFFSIIGNAALAAPEFSECRHFFVNGQLPVIQHKQELQLRALCFSSFAVLHSGRSHTPLYVAEKLNKETLLDAKNNQRTNKFFADARLPKLERAELEDYKGSGFDRGHMAPAGDMATPEAMAQSFSLANMVPQAPINNRKAWASIENATRKYVIRASGDVYVITGPVFDSVPDTVGESKVWVPKYLFKLVYDPGTGRSWAHWIENIDQARPDRPISYTELVLRTGIEFIPVLSQ